MGSRAAAVRAAIQGEGTATLDLTVGGTLDHPLPAGTLAVRSPSLDLRYLRAGDRLRVDALVDPTLITLRTVTAEWQGMSLTADGSLPWRVREPRQTPGAGAAAPSRLAAWLNALPAEPARARLTVRASNLTQAVLKDIVPPHVFARSREPHRRRSSRRPIGCRSIGSRRRPSSIPASVTLAGVPFTQTVPTRLRLENGRARIDDFQWTAEGNSIVASGGADLTAAQPSIDLGVAGRTRPAGAERLRQRHCLRRLGARQPADHRASRSPDIVGEVGVADGELQLDNPRLAATDIQGTLLIGDSRKVSVALAGLLNTGTAKINGTLDLADLASPLGKLQFTGRNVALEYPSGLQTESNVDLELALGDDLHAQRPHRRARRHLPRGARPQQRAAEPVLDEWNRQRGTAAGMAVTPRLNVAVATASDVRIDNNYGRLDVGASLRVVGTAASPGVIGRLEAADDGEIYLGGNTYRIERLTIDLANPRAITPEVNFSAQTRIGNLPIGIDLRCPAAAPCERKVTSLATGIDDKEAEARLFGHRRRGLGGREPRAAALGRAPRRGRPHRRSRCDPSRAGGASTATSSTIRR